MLFRARYTKSSLKENSRIYNCFKYFNLFFVSVAPPEKKNPHLQKKVNSMEWVKVTAEKAEQVQGNYTLRTGNTT